MIVAAADILPGAEILL